MQKFLKIIFVLIFATLGALVFSTRTQADFKAENPSAENASTAPKTLYARNCARCHGADGKGETELGKKLDAPDLTVDKTSEARAVRIITRGHQDMPAFGKKLKKTEIVTLAKYVRSL